MKIHNIRNEIDHIDTEIIKLLSERSCLVREAGKTKKSESAVRDAKRVEQVISKVKRKAAAEGLDPVIAEKVYRSIIECFINKEVIQFRDERVYFPDI